MQINLENSKFLIASPEKALLDKLYLDAGKQQLFDFVTESLRIEPDNLFKLNLETLASLSIFYENKRFIKRIQKLIKTVKGINS